MGKFGYEEPFEGLDSGLLDSMASFDEGQFMLHSLLSGIFKDKPDYEQYSDVLAEQITNQATHFTDLSTEVFGSLAESAEEARTTIARLWVADDNKRGELFNRLVGSEYYDMFDETRVITIVESLFEKAESVKELGELIYSKYSSNLCADIDNFIDISEKMPREGIKRFWLEIDVDVEDVKANLKNAAIVGVGLALGGLVTKTLLKSRRY